MSEERLDLVFETKSVAPSQRIIDGLAAVTGNEDSYGDIIEPGAFADALAGRAVSDIPVFVGHQHDSLPVGIPLEIREDSRGLFTRTRVFRTTAGDDLLSLAAERQAAGAPLGLSIGYKPGDVVLDRGRRRIRSLTLGEYSFTAMPANDKARVLAVKSAAEISDADLAIMNFEMLMIAEWLRAERGMT